MTGETARVRIDRDPTSKEEAEHTFENQDERRKRIRNDSESQDVSERKRYASHAYGITIAWIVSLMLLTVAEFVGNKWAFGLNQAEYITVFTTTSASVFGFWLLVGRYLFSARPAANNPSTSATPGEQAPPR